MHACVHARRLYELTEAQLGMLEQLFPRHILEYISSATDPAHLAQALPGLAHSHACVTVLFTDVVGEARRQRPAGADACMHACTCTRRWEPGR